jgi:6-phosphogluconolactonase
VTRPVEVFDDLEALSRRTEQIIAGAADEALGAGGRFLIALSGGSTPRRTYELLGASGALAREGVEVFFADERCVPPADHASNYRLVAETLGDRGNILRIRGEDDPDAAARAYEAQVRERFGDGPPAFDLVLLGIGADGHTASLFPDAPELAERRRLAVATAEPHAWVRRVTLSLPVLNAARRAVMLATGAEKAKAVAEILAGGTSPAARVLGARLLIDRAAATPPTPAARKRRPPPADELFDLSTETDGE